MLLGANTEANAADLSPDQQTQILAEALAGIAYVQLVKPGAPVIFGTFAAAVSMQESIVLATSIMMPRII